MTEQANRMENEGYITSAKAAAGLGNTVYTVYRHLKEGKLKGIQVTGHWYVDRKSLLRFLIAKVKDPRDRKRIIRAAVKAMKAAD